LKILFVSSGNSTLGISPIILNQGESLKKVGHEVEYFTIKGKGGLGYLRNIFLLRKFLKNNEFDIIHAHYSLSAMAVSLAGAIRIVVSFMGSDIKNNAKGKLLLRFFNRFFWKTIIVKSNDMAQNLGFKHFEILPNGVDFNKFYPIENIEAKRQLNWKSNSIHVLFAANPDRYEKNFSLAMQSFSKLNINNLELHTLKDIPFESINYWMNAADIVILSSLWEGSPNVIKEAMACNKVIVCTKVGDVEWLFGNEDGLFLSLPTIEDFSRNLNLAIEFCKLNTKSNARERLIKLELDSHSVATKLTNIYIQTLV
jgi:teichuronic acid biosynthesis glycosyltransferase TuaC